MSHWEGSGKSDEWYTPKYVFDAMKLHFEIDVASPEDRTHCAVPANHFITSDGLSKEWRGLVWMNPPFGGRNSIQSWLARMISHNNGVALTPDRTSAPWWQYAAAHAWSVLLVNHKIKFIKPDGSTGDQPSNGTTLMAFGQEAHFGLRCAEINGLGILMIKKP